ncbi:RsfA family transcriptional regulator [Halobacillus naozhouensis]|uniref:RsfA family transcriptional regulator n=1 Tax=Halobacillus naozhouensis TaxID=554880 RepID=A0ABY8IVD6_9BACI|nr:RsfA family transcriptional regulator [Halobacillus naozhouensis]WFT74133.1 RsfA family transcriptional regulator [Halobacillus naozhouensis]
MDTPRKAAWNKDEDLLLADTVLRYVREGNTQLSAFQEVGQRLNRTPSACGFRWNATVRQEYQEKIKEAKQDREGKRAVFVATNPAEETLISFDEAISFLKEMKKEKYEHQGRKKLEEEIERLQEDNRQLKNQIKKLEDSWIEMDKLVYGVKEKQKIK